MPKLQHSQTKTRTNQTIILDSIHSKNSLSLSVLCNKWMIASFEMCWVDENTKRGAITWIPLERTCRKNYHNAESIRIFMINFVCIDIILDSPYFQEYQSEIPIKCFSIYHHCFGKFFSPATRYADKSKPHSLMSQNFKISLIK